MDLSSPSALGTTNLSKAQSSNIFLKSLIITLFTIILFSLFICCQLSESKLLNYISGKVSVPQQEKRISSKITSRKKVALCITGNVRTFHYSHVHENILNNILLPLRAKHDTDVFFNVKFDDDPRPEHPKSIKNEQATLEAMKKFNPVQIHQLTPLEDYESKRFKKGSDKRLVKKPYQCKAYFNVANTPNSNFRSKQCLDMIKKKEQQLHFSYDYVYRTRPDVVFLDKVLAPEDMLNNTVYTNMVTEDIIMNFKKWWNSSTIDIPNAGDHFLACNRKNAEIALNSIETVNQCDYFNMKQVRNSESQLLYWLLSHNLQVNAGPWLWFVVREYNGAECHRVQALQMADRTLHNRMIKRCKEYNASIPTQL